mmetsp:Transcript_9384/g.16629  ORF Transcript_9384/g.16629 Transcript_9384/m.16629 type:complete len:327 (+) Transcript_9384:53-1033(+)
MACSERHISLSNLAGNELGELQVKPHKTINHVKKLIQKKCGTQLVCQVLLTEAGLLEQDDKLSSFSPHLDLTLLVLPFDPSIEQVFLQSASDGDVAGVLQSLKGRVDPDCTDDMGQSAMYLAARGGHNQIIRLLCNHSADVDVPCRNACRTPLAVAAARGNLASVLTLLAAKADVNVKSLDCVTPLWLASKRGHTKIMRKLLCNGADANRLSPLHKAHKFHNRRYFYHCTGGCSPVWIAAACGQRQSVELLCAFGAQHDQPNQHGITPAQAALSTCLSNPGRASLAMYLYFRSAGQNIRRAIATYIGKLLPHRKRVGLPACNDKIK